MPNTDDPINPDDPTVDLSKAAPKTTPVLEQILEGINALHDEVAGMREEQKATREELREFKAETAANFTRVDNAFEVIHNDLMRMRTDAIGHEKRLKDLERKAS